MFSKGTSRARQKLFDLNGPFSSFASKTLVAYTLGWISSDIYHDVNLVREIRNKFAHQLHGIDLETKNIRQLIDKFKLPDQLFSDWNDFRAVATEDNKSVVIYTGEPPDDAGEELNIQRLRYHLTVSRLVAHVAATLGLAIRIPDTLVTTNLDREVGHESSRGP